MNSSANQYVCLAEALITVESALGKLNWDRSAIGLVWLVNNRLAKGEREAVQAGIRNMVENGLERNGGPIEAFLEGLEQYEAKHEAMANWFYHALAKAGPAPAAEDD